MPGIQTTDIATDHGHSETGTGGRNRRRAHIRAERGCTDGDSAAGKCTGPDGRRHLGCRCLPEGQKLSAGLLPEIYVLEGKAIDHMISTIVVVVIEFSFPFP